MLDTLKNNLNHPNLNSITHLPHNWAVWALLLIAVVVLGIILNNKFRD